MKLKYFLYRMSRKIEPYAIERLMNLVSVSLLITLVADLIVSNTSGGDVSIYSWLYFDRYLILHGQVWRIFTFMLISHNSNLFFNLLAIYFYWWIGNAIENRFGKGMFNLYFFIGIIAIIISGFSFGYASTDYFYLSLFLAFAATFPEMELLLFFIIPVKVKWLGLVDAIFLIFILIQALIFRDFTTIAEILISFANFLLFFGVDIYYMIKNKMRK